ncbi:MAG TPA: type II secretion system F family protein [Burkholderiales bacterium]|jgi:MSHA biogenesis protein MshG|nr:type II secretion system F family protein [Burkholderiales bacterium]
MAMFAYKGRNPRGELVQGRLEGADTGAVADHLVNTGITPIEIKPSAGSAAAANDASRSIRQLFQPSISLVDLMLFSRQMYTLLKSGVPILRALGGLQESMVNPTFRAVIADLRASLDAGRELSAAMRRHPNVFSHFYISLVRVGESTGLLETVFLRLYEHLEFEKEVRERIKSALRYPMFVVAAMIGALIVVNIFVVPAFARLFESYHAKLPLMTRIVVGVSDFTVAFWPVMLVAALAGAGGFAMWRATPLGRYQWDKAKLGIPIAGKIVQKATLARFARSFALSLKSGVPVVQGLTTVAGVVDNAYIAKQIEQMRDGVERGESVLRTSVTAGVFTPVVLQMIAVGDETGELDDLLLEVAQLYEREVDYDVKTLSAQIEPILIIFLGALVLVLALAVFLPMWDLASVARKS